MLSRFLAISKAANQRTCDFEIAITRNFFEQPFTPTQDFGELSRVADGASKFNLWQGVIKMTIILKAIGTVHTDADTVPRHWTVSDVKGKLVIDEQYRKGLKDIHAGQQIVVIFHFHKIPAFTSGLLIQRPPHRNEDLGVFSTCSPRRPNPVGMSVLDVLAKDGNIIHVQGLDMLHETPILDLKPFVTDKNSCPSFGEDSV
jgi:tRNA-Thr(GGU) m(6)t(6)A37 methyltransferase TsaA